MKRQDPPNVESSMLEASTMQAGTDTHRNTRGWLVRSRRTLVPARCSLVDVARLILDGELGSEDEISAGDGSWARMSDVFEPEGLGLTLRALGHVA